MTALSTELPALPAPPALRLLPAPSSEPPYDDDLPRPVLRVVGPPAVSTPLLRAVPSPEAEEADLDVDAWLAARRTPSNELPAAVPFARALVQGLLEVLAGVRPVRQLRRDTTPELYAVLAQAVADRSAPAGPRPDGRAVRSLHAQAQHDGVVEVCATVQRGQRAAALALRLEGLDGRWRCTELAGF